MLAPATLMGISSASHVSTTSMGMGRRLQLTIILERNVWKGYLQGSSSLSRSGYRPEDTCRKFGYQVGRDKSDTLVQIAPYYDEAGVMVAQRFDTPTKNLSSLVNPNVLSYSAPTSGTTARNSLSLRVRLTLCLCLKHRTTSGCGIHPQWRPRSQVLTKHLEYLNGFEK